MFDSDFQPSHAFAKLTSPIRNDVELLTLLTGHRWGYTQDPNGRWRPASTLHGKSDASHSELCTLATTVGATPRCGRLLTPNHPALLTLSGEPVFAILNGLRPRKPSVPAARSAL